MKRTNDQTLKQAIDDMLNAYKLTDKLKEMELVSNWEEIVGKAVSNRTSEVYIKNKRLFLKLSSAVLRKELAMNRQKLIQLLNDHSGSEVVTEVILL